VLTVADAFAHSYFKHARIGQVIFSGGLRERECRASRSRSIAIMAFPGGGFGGGGFGGGGFGEGFGGMPMMMGGRLFLVSHISCRVAFRCRTVTVNRACVRSMFI